MRKGIFPSLISVIKTFGSCFLAGAFVFSSLSAAGMILAGSAFAPSVVSAATPEYAAEWIGTNYGSGISIPPGKGFTVELKVKNVGTATWLGHGPHYMELATDNPVRRDSAFHHRFWVKDFLPAVISEDEVGPGQVATLRFAIQAPDSYGHHEEDFLIVAKNLSWVENGKITIPIRVEDTPSKEAPASAPTASPSPTTSTDDSGSTENDTTAGAQTDDPAKFRDTSYEAFKLISSYRDRIVMKPGEKTTVRIGFKNNGTQTWTRDGSRYVSLYTYSPKYRSSPFYDPGTWRDNTQIKMESETVAPGELGYFVFDLVAPSETGRYTENFLMAAEGHTWVKGGELAIPVTVESNAPKPAPTPSVPTTGNDTDTGTTTNIPTVTDPTEPISYDGHEVPLTVSPDSSGPIIRVGLMATEDFTEITANGPYHIYDGTDTLVHTLPAGTVSLLAFNFDNKHYSVKAGAFSYDTTNYLRFVPQSEDVIMEMPSYEDRPSWNRSVNYNRWRGTLEARYAPATGRFWIINELPMEHYLYGIKETSNVSPHEYLKTMAVAARTYAFYHLTNPRKHANEHYRVNDTSDQVYRGYSSELTLPNHVKAVDQTNGVIVTYEGDVAVTPYYSSSDGRTRSYQEVWGSTYFPYLVSVPTPYDAAKGRRLWGHGVGLSAYDALDRANDGYDYRDILKYYYTGIGLRQEW